MSTGLSLNRAPLLRVVIPYAAVASAYILWSDRLVFALVRDPDTAFRIGLWKGWGFVVVTAALLFWLLQRIYRRESGRHRAFFEKHHAAMLLIDPASGDIVAANPAAQQYYGWTREQLASMNVGDINALPPDQWHLELTRAQRMEQNVFHARHRTASGEVRDVDVLSGPAVPWGEGLVLCVVVDALERQRAVEERRETDDKFRALVERSLVGVFMIDSRTIIYSNPRTDSIFGYAYGELHGAPFDSLIAERDRAAVLEELDRLLLRKIAIGRIEFEGRRKQGDRVMVGVQGTLTRFAGTDVVIGVLQDITDKLRAEELERRYLAHVERAMESSINAVSHMVDLRDPYTAGHERRVGEIAAAIGAEMGFDADRQRGLRVAGAVHDVGKIMVPAEILAKPGQLLAAEFELVRAHAEQGYAILKGIDFPWPVAEVSAQHHERMDGSGYPKGLAGDRIVLEARILAVADVVESMSSHRPYRAARGVSEALAEIETHAGRLYDPAPAAACLRLFREKGFAIPD